MGCSSCSTGSNGLPGGCKNNGACGTYGCNKLDVFDWLAGMELAQGQKPFDLVEVRFKNSRKAFYRNSSNLELFAGDVIAVDVSPGYDVGVVSLTGELVRVQMKRKDIKDNYEIKKILRKATEEDIQRWQDGRTLEQNTMMRARTIAREISLDMKLSDVEYQGDKTKATFFYTADDRVDFRELIKRYAEEFRVRIDMRQIGYRYEAGRLGGIGSCGRELCCSSWLTDFRAVSTSAARYQQLSLNPTKLAGQCGKLKCCLNFELDQYVEALRDFPSVNTRLKLPKGTASHFKTDIFQRIMFFVYEGQFGEAPFPLSVDAVKEILEKNKKGIAIEDIDAFMVEEVVEKGTDFAEVVGQDSLTRFDRTRSNNRGGQNRGKQPNDNRTSNSRGPRPNKPAEGSSPQVNPEQQQQRTNKPSQPRNDRQQPRGPRPQREIKNPNPAGQPAGGEQNKNQEGRQPQGDRNRGRGRSDNRPRPPREGGDKGAQAPNKPTE